MNKKLVAVVIMCSICIASLSLVGCAKNISGNCAEVVSQCQSMSSNDQATVTVKGSIRLGQDNKQKLLLISDNGQTGTPYVAVYISDEESQVPFGKTTFKGELDASRTTSDSITIMNATIVKTNAVS